MKRIFLFISTLFISQVNCIHAASFDCGKANGFVEETICTNKWLSDLDDELSKYYFKLYRSLSSVEALELQKEQRHWLKKRTEICTDQYNKLSCLGEMYRKRLTDLKIKFESPFLPSNSELKLICTDLAAISANERREYGTTENIEDINNDGVKEKPEECLGGTMHVPCSEYSLPNGKNLEINTINFEWKDYWTYGLKIFSKNGKQYKLNAYDDNLEKPAYLSYVTPENNEYVVCEFETDETEKFSPNQNVPNSNQICSAIKNNDSSKISYISFSEVPTLSRDEVRDSFNRYETGVEGQEWVDYDNDGAKNHIALLEYASGAGRGCDFNYFDELNIDGKSFIESPKRNLLLKMQDVDLKGRHPNCGGMNNSFFKYNDINYYEMKKENEHKISYISNGQIVQVCAIDKLLSTKVKSVGFIEKK